jgi:hypothetical protein
MLDTSNSCNEAHVHVTPHVFLSLHVAWVLDNIGGLKEQLVISKAYQLERDKYAKSMRKVTQCERRMQGVRYAKSEYYRGAGHVFRPQAHAIPAMRLNDKRRAVAGDVFLGKMFVWQGSIDRAINQAAFLYLTHTG